MIDRLSVASLSNDLAVYMHEGEAARATKIHVVLERLDPGAYLIGTGPYTRGVFPLAKDEIVLGRMATPLEESSGIPLDIVVNDLTTLTPREVSRVHCAIFGKPSPDGYDYFLEDRGSTCGTFLNNKRLQALAESDSSGVRFVHERLSDGDVICLGPSFINTFVFARVGHTTDKL